MGVLWPGVIRFRTGDQARWFRGYYNSACLDSPKIIKFVLNNLLNDLIKRPLWPFSPYLISVYVIVGEWRLRSGCGGHRAPFTIP